MNGQLVGHGLVFADRRSPLHPFVGPFAGNLQRKLGRSGANGRQRQTAGVERRQGDLQAAANATDHVSGRDAHVLETDQAVFDAPQAHEAVAGEDGDTRANALPHERGDPSALAARSGARRP